MLSFDLFTKNSVSEPVCADLIPHSVRLPAVPAAHLALDHHAIHISGYIGASALRQCIVHLVYRDGLVKLDYTPGPTRFQLRLSKNLLPRERRAWTQARSGLQHPSYAFLPHPAHSGRAPSAIQ
jgi:hypothetical protein